MSVLICKCTLIHLQYSLKARLFTRKILINSIITVRDPGVRTIRVVLLGTRWYVNNTIKTICVSCQP